MEPSMEKNTNATTVDAAAHGASHSTTKGVAVGAGVGAGIGAGVWGLVAPVVNFFGFGASGIAAGSTAASMMSTAAIANGGGVAAGSTVAVLQNVGAVGLATPVGLGLVTAGVAIGGATVGVNSLYTNRPASVPSQEQPIVASEGASWMWRTWPSVLTTTASQVAQTAAVPAGYVVSGGQYVASTAYSSFSSAKKRVWGTSGGDAEPAHQSKL